MLLRRLSILIISLIFFYLLTALLLYLFQKRLIYFPTKAVDHELASFDFESDNCKINVIAINDKLPSDSVIVYFGGNGETVAYAAMQFDAVFDDIPMFFLNYPGYGKSECSPSEKAIYAAALKLFDLSKEKYPKVIVLGRSLGSGVASYVASKRDASGLILVTPYDSIEKIAQATLPGFPMSLLLNQKFLSINNVANIDEKSLALIAASDSTIPRKNSDRLVAAFSPEQIDKVIIDAGHNDISNQVEYFELIADFVRSD